MMRVVLRALSGAVLVGGLTVGLSGEPSSAQQPYRPNAIDAAAPVTKEGWWIRVNPSNQATNISWRFGAQRNRLSNPLRWWKDEYPVEFDLPAAQRNLNTLHVATYGLPYKQTVSYCLFFRDHGAAVVEFSGEKVQAVEQTAQEAACVP
jgi:hypothetical protein